MGKTTISQGLHGKETGETEIMSANYLWKWATTFPSKTAFSLLGYNSQNRRMTGTSQDDE